MANPNTIVAVGGTGTHVAIAYLRMAILSNMPVRNIPNIVIIDADVGNGSQNDNKLSLLNAAKQLFSQVVSGADDKAKPEWHDFVPYRTQARQNGGGEVALPADTEFSQFLLGESRRTAQVDDRQILDSLFTRPVQRKKEDDPLSEQEILIRDGFYASPSVGATAMYDLLSAAEDSKLRKTLRQLCGLDRANTAFKSMVIVGSSSGGTGSGAGPAVAQWIQTELDKVQGNNVLARIGLFMTLPWFTPVTKDDGTPPSAGTPMVQRMNSAAGIRMYQVSPTMARMGVYIVDYFGLQSPRQNEGNSGQSENRHPLPLILADQIQNFFMASNDSDRVDQVQGAFTFFNQSAANSGARPTFDAKNSPLLAFSRDAKERLDLQDWALNTQSMRLILATLGDFIRDGYRPNGPKSSVAARPNDFKVLMLRLAEAKLGPSGITKSSMLFGIGTKEIEVEEIRRDLVDAIRQREAELADSILWLKGVVENSSDGNSPMLLIDAAAIAVDIRADMCAQLPAFEKGDPARVVYQFFEKAFNTEFTRAAGISSADCIAGFEELIGQGANGENGRELDPDTAAVFVIERQIRRLIQHGQQGQLTERMLDPYRSTLPVGLVAKSMLPIEASERPVTRYLASIKFGELVDDSRDRNGQIVKIQDMDHPFTVAELKSRAIPSPWAAAHRQAWQSLHGSQGLRQIQQQSLEAVLWGIFTKRLALKRVDASHTRLGHMLTTSLAAELNLQAEDEVKTMLVAVDAKQPEDVVAANHPTVGWFVAPWLLEESSACRVVWWQMKRFGLTLPSQIVTQTVDDEDYVLREVRSFYDTLQQLRGLHQRNAQLDLQLQLPWLTAVAELSQKLEIRVKHVAPIPVDTTVSAETMLLLCRGTDGTMGMIKARVPVLQQSLVEVHRAYFPSTLVSVALPPKDKNDPAVRHPDLPVFARFAVGVQSCRRVKEIAVSDDKFILHYELTIKGLGKTTVELPSQRVDVGAYLGIFPNFRMEGWKRYMVGCTCREEDFHFMLLNDAGEVIDDLSERSFRHNHVLNEPPRHVVLYARQTEFSAEFGLEGEVGCFETQLTPVNEMGLGFSLGLDLGTSNTCFYPVATNGGQVIEGVDFSRAGQDLTCVMWENDYVRGQVEEFTNFMGIHGSVYNTEVKRVLPSELKLHAHGGAKANAQSILQPDAMKDFSQLPYEYKNAAASTNVSQPGEYLTDFKWPVNSSSTHGLKGTPFSERQPDVLRVYLEHLLLVGFAMLRAKGYSTMDVLRITYPEAFKQGHLIAYAENLIKILQTVAAYTGIQIRLTVTDLLTRSEISVPLQQLTAEKLYLHREGETFIRTPSAQTSCLVSESLAAISAEKPNIMNNIQGVTLVLDMGGGTTDVTAFAFAQNPEIYEKLGLKSITDSILYAGNDVLSMLNTGPILQDMYSAIHFNEDKSMSGADDEQGRLVLIKRLMRNTRAISALREAMHQQKHVNQFVQITAFFDGLVAYAAQVAKAYQVLFDQGFVSEGLEGSWNLNVILLGNGWRLTDLVYTPEAAPAARFIRHLKEVLRTELGTDSKVNIHADFTARSGVSVKEAIAYGALNLHRHQTDLASVSRFGFIAGLPLKLSKDVEVFEKAATEFMEIMERPDDFRSAKGRVEVDIKKPNILSKSVSAQYERMLNAKTSDRTAAMQALAGALNNRFSRYIADLGVTNDAGIKLAPYGTFLETVWKDACAGLMARR